jgi:hypothetical protein
MSASATAELASLRERTALRAAASLSFYVTAVLGHRGIRAVRLDELQRGAEARTRTEQTLVESWERFKQGESTNVLRLEGVSA